MAECSELNQLLQTSEGFAGATFEDIANLIDGLEPCKIEEGVDVVREGEPGKYVWVLIRGELGVYAENGDEINRISNSGDVFGEISAVSLSGATATVRSLTEVEALAIPHQRLHHIMAHSPSLAASLLRSMAKYLDSR